VEAFLCLSNSHNLATPFCFFYFLNPIPPNALKPTSNALTNNQSTVLWEVIRRHLQVQRRRALSDTSRDIIMGSVARAEPASKVTSLSNWHTTQVRADAQHDEPFGLLDAVCVGLGVTKLLPVVVLGLLDLIACAVADENWLAAPLDNDVLALGDGGQVDLNLGLGEHVGGSGHVYQEVLHGVLRTQRGDTAHGADHEVLEQLVAGLATGAVVLEAGDGGGVLLAGGTTGEGGVVVRVGSRGIGVGPAVAALSHGGRGAQSGSLLARRVADQRGGGFRGK